MKNVYNGYNEAHSLAVKLSRTHRKNKYIWRVWKLSMSKRSSNKVLRGVWQNVLNILNSLRKRLWNICVFSFLLFRIGYLNKRRRKLSKTLFSMFGQNNWKLDWIYNNILFTKHNRNVIKYLNNYLSTTTNMNLFLWKFQVV